MQSSGEDHLHTTEIMTERCSQDTQNSNGSTPWTYLADEHLIDREKFDFDLPVSPVESEKVEVDDEDEVFFGPVGFTEACIAKKTQLHSQSPNECKPMSPLNVEQYLELFLEANKVAMELTKEKKRDASQGSDDQGCTGKETGAVDDFSKKTEESTVGGVVADSQKQSEQSTGAKPSTEVSDCHIERVAVANLPGKTDVRNFKRLVRKDMRSPRRGTYTISVSPANTPPPPHLPSADDCVSKLARDKPQTLTFTAAQSNKQLSLKAPKSKLPVKGTQRSKLPLKGGLKKLVPPPNPSSGTSTDKLLRKKLSSPPKRKRLNSCESEDLISEASSSLASETSDTPSLSLGQPKGKRPQPGSFHTKGTTGPHPPTKAATSSSTVASSQHKSTDKAAAVNSVKAPAAKPRLLQQGPLQRRVVQASRQLKPVKPGQRGFLQSANRPQPVKAVVGLVKVPSANKDASEATPKKAGNLRQTPSRKLCTPTVSTPVHQDKKVVPKRLLTNEQSASKPAARSLSTSTMPTPQSKLMPPSTPSRSDSKVVPASASSMWRRSGIPTPSRRSIASSSRLSSTSSTISNPSPVQFRALRTSTTTSSPSGSPPPPKPAPPTAKEAIIKLDLDSSPACTKEVTLCDGRAPLETKTNLQEGKTNSPVVGLLVDIIPDPEEKLSKDAVSREGSRLYKENLIDLL
ncbi:flocculation protein FLO11-like isoform X2 [Acanthaster planci]|uniref:Flocculation protein FLO11-like isoform X2 n=1 Tax=Acanthaster planci TaxID=133434 RepID=A0A8B7ZCC5_ACAPL|nr:flocculation protein FLO11-like isoform X2 [Acanthaster planci]